MFPRYSVETKVVKTNRKSQVPTEPTETVDSIPSWIEKIQRKDVIHAAAGLVVTYAAVVAVNTISTIAINYAPKN